jgi:hypothetical protein
MITFEELYPDRLTDIEYEGSTLMRSKNQGLCFHCNRLTYWIDLLFEAYVCSPNCEDAKWQEYFKA